GAAAPACACACAVTSVASIRCGGARGAWAATPPKAGLGPPVGGIPTYRPPVRSRRLGHLRACRPGTPARIDALADFPPWSKRTDHVSNASGQITCQRHYERLWISGEPALGICSCELSRLLLRLFQPVRHPYLAVHRHGGSEVLLRPL